MPMQFKTKDLYHAQFWLIQFSWLVDTAMHDDTNDIVDYAIWEWIK